MTHLHTIEGDSRFVKGKVVESALEFYVQRKSVRVKKEVGLYYTVLIRLISFGKEKGMERKDQNGKKPKVEVVRSLTDWGRRSKKEIRKL